MMSRAVNLVNKPAQLAELLSLVGVKHAMYGAEPHHFELVGTVLTRALKKSLGDEFDTSFAAEWVRVYNSIAAAMIRASQTEGALAWKRRSTKERLIEFSGCVKDVLDRVFSSDINKLCHAWLLEAATAATGIADPSAAAAAVTHATRSVAKEVSKSAWSRAASALAVLLTTRLQSAAQYNDLSQLAQGAIKAAPHLLIWIRTVMHSVPDDRTAVRCVVNGIKTLLVKHSLVEVTKLRSTIMSLFVNYFAESIASQIREIQIAAPHAPLTTPLGMLVTDIESSSFLFNSARTAMCAALRGHCRMLRDAIRLFRCHEVRARTVGDSFVIVGADMARLAGLAVFLQERQHALRVEPALAALGAPPSTASFTPAKGASLPPGQLRVKCALHWCTLAVAVGTTSSGVDTFDYVGPDSLVAPRILDFCAGGRVILSRAAAVRLVAEVPAAAEAFAAFTGGAHVTVADTTATTCGAVAAAASASSSSSSSASPAYSVNTAVTPLAAPAPGAVPADAACVAPAAALTCARGAGLDLVGDGVSAAAIGGAGVVAAAANLAVNGGLAIRAAAAVAATAAAAVAPASASTIVAAAAAGGGGGEGGDDDAAAAAAGAAARSTTSAQPTTLPGQLPAPTFDPQSILRITIETGHATRGAPMPPMELACVVLSAFPDREFAALAACDVSHSDVSNDGAM